MQLLASQKQHCCWLLAVTAEGSNVGNHLLNFHELLGEGTAHRLSDPVLTETLNERNLCKTSCSGGFLKPGHSPKEWTPTLFTGEMVKKETKLEQDQILNETVSLTHLLYLSRKIVCICSVDLLFWFTTNQTRTLAITICKDLNNLSRDMRLLIFSDPQQCLPSIYS